MSDKIAKKAPNILVLMADQHRADVMGNAGNPVVRTPNLDRLATESISFSRSYCQGPLCMPARASFITERYVRDHGVNNNKNMVSMEMPTFLHKLQEAGYYTSCIGKMHLYRHGDKKLVDDTRKAIDILHALGFDEPIETVGKLSTCNIRSEYTDYLEALGLYQQYRKAIAKRNYTSTSLPRWHAESLSLPVETYQDAWLGRRTVQWLEEYDREQPWFLWVGFAGPHDPWDAPKEYVEPYRNIEIPLGSNKRPQVEDGNPFKESLQHCLKFSDSDTLTDDRIRQMRRYYYANVTLIDDAVGQILQALKNRGMLENTWIIYTSDHGEMMGDLGLLTKMVFYEPSVRVPSIVRPPGGTNPRLESDLVEHIDLAATIRTIANTPDLPNSCGRSLLDYFPIGTNEFQRQVVRSQNFGFAMFATNQYKLVIEEKSLEIVQFFDLQEDPNEEIDLSCDRAYAAIRDELMAEYVRPFFN